MLKALVAIVHSRDNDYWYKRKDCKISFEPMRSETWSVLNQTHSGVSYDQVKKRLGNVLGTMKRKLELALVSEQRSEISRRKKHGRLDSRKLTNVVSFDTEVFRRRVMSTAINTAVTIVVDLSGSMSGGRLELAEVVVLQSPMHLRILKYLLRLSVIAPHTEPLAQQRQMSQSIKPKSISEDTIVVMPFEW